MGSRVAARARERSVLTVSTQKRLEGGAQLGWQIGFADGMEQGYGRLVGLELRDASWARGQMPFEFSVHVRRKMLLDEVRQESDEIVAASLVAHGQVSVPGPRVSGQETSFKYPNPKPEKPETESRGEATAMV